MAFVTLTQEYIKEIGQELANKILLARDMIDRMSGLYFKRNQLINEAKADIDAFIEKYKYQCALAFYG